MTIGDARIETVHRNVTICKKSLEQMKMEIAEFEESVGENYHGCEVKMRQTMHGRSVWPPRYIIRLCAGLA